MKKLIAFFLLVMLLLSISACSEKGYGREEIVKAAEPLLKESQILNEIYFGEGIPVKETLLNKAEMAQAIGKSGEAVCVAIPKEFLNLVLASL